MEEPKHADFAEACGKTMTAKRMLQLTHSTLLCDSTRVSRTQYLLLGF